MSTPQEFRFLLGNIGAQSLINVERLGYLRGIFAAIRDSKLANSVEGENLKELAALGHYLCMDWGDQSQAEYETNQEAMERAPCQ